MFTKYYNPHAALEEYVESICVMGHDFTPESPLSPIYTFMPTHTRYICFYLEDPVKVKKSFSDFEERSRSVIIGPQLNPVTLDLGKKHSNVIVILKPSGLYRLLGFPLSEIVDRDFDTNLILGKEINDVIDRMINDPDSDKRNSIIQEYLLGKLNKLKPSLPIDNAMLQLVRSKGKLPMDLLMSQSCLGVRQLERQSLERIGLPPKFFARMIRFSEAYKFKERNPKSTWTDICYRFGYFDQMHLIRDFRQFTGGNPSSINEATLMYSIKLISHDI